MALCLDVLESLPLPLLLLEEAASFLVPVEPVLVSLFEPLVESLFDVSLLDFSVALARALAP